MLPRGTPLPDAVWLSRHRVFLAAAWASGAVVLVWAALAGGPLHALVDGVPVVAAAAVATLAGSGRRGREAASSAVMLALMIATAMAVHLSGGLIEAHFLFFVVVGAAAAYQTWAPFLTAVGFVLLHHGLLGTLAGHTIFNHPQAQERPWLWALIHAGLLAAAAAVGIASWRADEMVRERLAELGARSRLIMSTVEDAIVAVDTTGCVVEANPAATRLLGAGRPVRRRPLQELVPGVCDVAQMRDLARGQRPAVPGEAVVPSAQGGPVRVGVRVVPVRGDESVRAVVTLRDLSTAERADNAERALVDLTERERAQRRDVAALSGAVRPPALAVEGLELAVAYEPAASAPAGGDLYDWLVLPSGEVLVVVVDAMGRGTAATRDALAVTTTVRTLAVAGCPLEDLVARAAAVLDVTSPELLATLLVAVVDPPTGRVRLAGGGHPPALVVSPGAAREVSAEGLGIGYPDPGSFAVREVVLAPGESLVLYTDGLIEGTHDVSAGLRELAGTAAELAAELAAVPPSELAARLLTDVVTCALDDDDCLALVVRRPGVPAPERQAPHGVPFTHDVPADPAQVRPARSAAAVWLAGQGIGEDTADTCLLLLSELVGNSVRHGGSAARVRLSRTGREVLLEVEDCSAALPVVREDDVEATGGRGMQLVGVLSSRWGTRPTAEGKTVWCAVPLDGLDEAPALRPLHDLAAR
ncbi:hypothetical protein NUM3379_22300 [Kineococcus sp. NUM-3379]